MYILSVSPIDTQMDRVQHPVKLIQFSYIFSVSLIYTQQGWHFQA